MSAENISKHSVEDLQQQIVELREKIRQLLLIVKNNNLALIEVIKTVKKLIDKVGI